MDSVMPMIEALQYIEARLQEELRVADIAAEAGYSKFHFQRLFHQVTNETVGQYIQHRRLTEAAKVLHERNVRIVDVAFQYGFESHEAFTRAFKNKFGLTPFQYQATGRLPHYLLRNAIEPDYLRNLKEHIIDVVEELTLDQLHLAGYDTAGNTQKEILACWRELDKRLLTEESERFGVVQYPETDCLELEYRYLAASRTEAVQAAVELRTIMLPSSKYIVFDHRGPVDTLPLTYQYIYGTWLSRHSYDLGSPFDFEYYGSRFLGIAHPESVIRIFVPIRG